MLRTLIPSGSLFRRATCATSQLAPSLASSPSSIIPNYDHSYVGLSAQRSAGGSSVGSQVGVVFDSLSGEW
ncbi:hypothetical protein BDQ17DRAFT_1384213 [Cyathus striatus]|nr:hypothetical protein BDQ17DRAFT_1384213 [Cyathus striatus]